MPLFCVAHEVESRKKWPNLEVERLHPASGSDTSRRITLSQDVTGVVLKTGLLHRFGLPDEKKASKGVLLLGFSPWGPTINSVFFDDSTGARRWEEGVDPSRVLDATRLAIGVSRVIGDSEERVDLSEMVFIVRHGIHVTGEVAPARGRVVLT